ncbi:DUF3574 domain-containing protein [Adhaeribacter pallidiroseus]|uniref:DUF3574 domain-containing protein n=1 Tax=Adhaeribacter pallidiroseus TaxID=2072847 RepID=A0A369QSD5_9BACT|nr:DUF3574 domain-containing protein [Adhaeribacter pallidiroseus]RDC66236.1 hypothetical protein AHMF7616_04867 [Adhaeribacter pallidiroseus]
MKTSNMLPLAIFRLRLTFLYTLLGLMLSAGLMSCEKEDVKPQPEKTDQWVLDRLYFGRSMPNGKEVSGKDWNLFVDEVITPRFPDGLTQWEAAGQWQEEDGVITRESTFILEIVHPEGKTDDAKLNAIIQEYKKRFQQESVLRITHPAAVEF